MCILFVFSTFSSQIQWFFCHYHLTNRMNLMAGAMCRLANLANLVMAFIARKITMFFLPRADILNLPAPHHVRCA